ncbi:unnamed protein product [Ranitomeya imitator]|uniref:Uncharacterized protein n=1 Tax=Ranitomeya imitator TaxID=111125 RepID=A0ABN9LH77_9NEOB|nr:unnamed protein product [Ranitomeya imitator]
MRPPILQDGSAQGEDGRTDTGGRNAEADWLLSLNYGGCEESEFSATETKKIRNIMEAMKKLAAQEELRLKLLEYLAAKGKLKPPNNKPYLKDCINLQTTRPLESSKQIGEKSAPKKRSHFALESNKNKPLNAGSHPYRLGTGKIPTEQSSNRSVNKASSRKPLPPKTNVPRETLTSGTRQPRRYTRHPSPPPTLRRKKALRSH